MSQDRFISLVEENNGFEFYQAYRGDVDHVLGGKDGTYWYVIMKKGKVTESYIGKNSTGVWEDICIKGTGANKKAKTMPNAPRVANCRMSAIPATKSKRACPNGQALYIIDYRLSTHMTVTIA